MDDRINLYDLVEFGFGRMTELYAQMEEAVREAVKDCTATDLQVANKKQILRIKTDMPMKRCQLP